MSLSKFYPTSDTDDVDPASVWTSLKSIEIPTTDILTYTFDNLGQYDQDSPVGQLGSIIAVQDSDLASQIFIDANNPSNKISAKQAVETVVRLAKGLKALGLKDGECVCLHAFNSVCVLSLLSRKFGSGRLLRVLLMLCNLTDQGAIDLVSPDLAGNNRFRGSSCWVQSEVHQIRARPFARSHQTQVRRCSIRLHRLDG